MCDDCGKKTKNYDWARDRDGNPKLTPNGSYMLVDEMGAYFGFSIETLHIVRDLFEEVEAVDEYKTMQASIDESRKSGVA